MLQGQSRFLGREAGSMLKQAGQRFSYFPPISHMPPLLYAISSLSSSHTFIVCQTAKVPES